MRIPTRAGEVFVVRLRTAGKSRAALRQHPDFAPVLDQDLDHLRCYYDTLEGQEVLLQVAPHGLRRYLLVGWPPAADAALQRAFFALEQDSLLGAYQGDWPRFQRDWRTAAYLPICQPDFGGDEFELLLVQAAQQEEA